MAELSSADINDLPDSAFAYIESGGTKDSSGKTTPRSLRHFPIHDAAHVRNALARAGQSPFGAKALPKIKAAAAKMGVDVGEEQQAAGRSQPLPFEAGGVFVRSMLPGPEVQEVSGAMPKLVGTLAVFDEWAEIKSASEGHFLEKISRGAFAKTLRDHPNVPVMYQHGEDPQIGPKPLGTVDSLLETQRGVEYQVSLFDVDYVRSLLPALKAGKAAGLGSSFTMRMPKGKYDLDRSPRRSAHNPDQLPELTHSEILMLEFGPGVMPYYSGTDVGLRSSTDELVFGRLARDPDRLQQLLTMAGGQRIMSAQALSDERAEATHSGGESRDIPRSVVADRPKFETSEEFVRWLSSKT